MSAEQDLIQALEKVVELDPQNASIRTQLAELLLKAGNGPEALKHVQFLLNERPDHRAALNLAVHACELAGDHAKAGAYKRMAEALGSQLIDGFSSTPVTEQTKVQENSPDGLQFIDREKTQEQMELIPPPGLDKWRVDGSTLRLSDVAGLENVKRRLQLSFLGPLQSQDLREAFGQTTQGGLLLYGPPGCGKTFLAKAVAGELGAGFLNVAISEVMDMWYGNSEKFMHEAFEAARFQKPCVLFFDEVDALARKRSSFTGQVGRSLVNQLLAEMDGVNSKNDGVYILAATNHPWDLDSAVRRPGRLDRILFVSPPDAEARVAIAQRTMAKIPHEQIDFKWIGDNTDGFSGADMAHLSKSAAEFALAESMKSGRVCPVVQRHFKQALKDVRPSMRSWFDSARNYALFSNQGGEYDDLLEYMKTRRMV